MARVTHPSKRSFSASIGAGLGSVFRGSGKQYYILEHKISSRYYKIGESQEIIIDRIELGRNPTCQVRFDESFPTVSRRHAAIIKEGDNWKLIHLSRTNPTFVNGRRINFEWYLQNGDEIQLSVGGPRLGFIVPSGNQSTVGSIRLTRRLSLFRQQALRPYKTAITLLSILLILSVGGLAGWKIYDDKQNNENFKKLTTEYNEKIKGLLENNDELTATLDSLKNVPPPPPTTVIVRQPAVEIVDLIEKCKDDIYFLSVTNVYLTNGRQRQAILLEDGSPYGWTGTGFLLDDGRFVTARHCVQSWRFETDKYVLNQVAFADSYAGVEIVATIRAISRTGKRFEFRSTDFICIDRYDKTEQIGVDSDGDPLYLTSALLALFAGDIRIFSTDWAYVHTSLRGTISADQQLSNNLRTGAELHTLGFPGLTGVRDTYDGISPAYNRFTVGFDGLDISGCFLHTRGIDSGNSGGPIFARRNDKLVVVGIVSRTSHKSDEYSYGVPIAAIR